MRIVIERRAAIVMKVDQAKMVQPVTLVGTRVQEEVVRTEGRYWGLEDLDRVELTPQIVERRLVGQTDCHDASTVNTFTSAPAGKGIPCR